LDAKFKTYKRPTPKQEGYSGMAEAAAKDLRDEYIFDPSRVRSNSISPPERHITENDIDDMKEKCPMCQGHNLIVEGEEAYCEDCGYHNMAHEGSIKDPKTGRPYPIRRMGKAWKEYQIKKQLPAALAGEAAKQVGDMAAAPGKMLGNIFTHAGQIGQQTNQGPAPSQPKSAMQSLVGGAARTGLGVAQGANAAYNKYKATNAVKKPAAPSGNATATVSQEMTPQGQEATPGSPAGQQVQQNVSQTKNEENQQVKASEPNPNAVEAAQNTATAAHVVSPEFMKKPNNAAASSEGYTYNQ
jgi:hypothetical protein